MVFCELWLGRRPAWRSWNAANTTNTVQAASYSLKTSCPVHPPPCSLADEGMVKRIRGVAYSTRVSPQASNRMVDGARSVLNQVGVLLAGSKRRRGCHAGQLAC